VSFFAETKCIERCDGTSVQPSDGLPHARFSSDRVAAAVGHVGGVHLDGCVLSIFGGKYRFEQSGDFRAPETYEGKSDFRTRAWKQLQAAMRNGRPLKVCFPALCTFSMRTPLIALCSQLPCCVHAAQVECKWMDDYSAKREAAAAADTSQNISDRGLQLQFRMHLIGFLHS
jgi:hypothetical protein